MFSFVSFTLGRKMRLQQLLLVRSVLLDRCRRSPRRQMLRLPRSFVQARTELWACVRRCVTDVSTPQVRKKSKQATPKLHQASLAYV